ncbi:MAG: iron export ABC transporter permease subunit FetB [Planctomycetes bacterium]|nr:iron export ABC transporter permease subunit FetB [Planctomycetota bacterium]MDP6409376.1 iron export ABC transporter permease subunit FetB [Planctomycetota bacterium]
MNGPIELGWGQLAIAASLVCVNGLVSLWLHLGLGRRLLIASLRTCVQLILLGYVLVAVFEWRSALGVGAIAAGMVLLAARESVRRAGRSYAGIGRDSLLSLALVGGATTVMATAVIVGVEPWWEPRYLIPFLGMVLGNGLTGISLGLERCLRELDEGRVRVEFLLAQGATRWEASRDVAADAVRGGMVPILNSMTVVGLVTIPGMMTGQLLGGISPLTAARYQILIMFLIASATAAGVTAVVLLSLRALFDEEHRLRIERVRRVRGG